MSRFSNFMCEVVENIHNLIFQNKNLTQTRDLLLPKLISGEIDVSELDIDPTPQGHLVLHIYFMYVNIISP